MLNKYLALTRRSIGLMFEYRASMVIWMLTGTFPLIMLAVWLSLARDGPVGSYSAADFVGYYLLALYVRQMTVAWVAWDLENDIRHGELSIKLLHPLNPIHEYVSLNLADKILRVALLTPLLVFVAWLVPGVHYALSVASVLLFGFALVIAWMLRYMLQYVTGLLSFWTSQATSLLDFEWMLFLLLGGSVAPLDLLPGPLGRIATYLPFRFMLSFPIEIMQGKLSQSDLLTGMAVGIGWMLLAQVAALLVWRRGLREFSAFGA